MDTTVFVGRQPIFDRRKQVFGYELLYRSNGTNNAFDGRDGDAASGAVMNNSLNVMGFEEVVGGRKAFINMTRRLLVDESYAMLPSSQAVVELLETVEPDAEVVTACRKLKDQGYLLALDDFVYKPQYQPLVNLADIIKIDFRVLDAKQRAQYAKRFGGGRQALLAEKVETPGDFQEAMRLGYSYFQGYFFCKPEIVAGKELPAVKANYLRFLQEVNRQEVNYDQLENVVKHELSLSTKLLRYLNSAGMGLRNKLTSIKQALVLLGEKPLRKWASLVATSALGEDKPPELLVTSLTRARLAESLAETIGYRGRELDLFLMGLFSAMDAMLDQPLDELMSRLPVPEDVSAALLGADTQLGRVCRLMLSLEQGVCEQLEAAARDLKLSMQDLSTRYRQAVVWADQMRV